ncbi:GyrI-like domain-containing protein [Streptomyces litchfieldiae]|uniref:GyrI-like domain-containing protein n=1 Tax=Streptomyces litchfieldiae TaxID=3075543 RepID=A0ABU2MWD6_9ACTN|nr:GyrI-like domain-containing protein [Streptomyces sp. DSM 44938]MDT0344874.1 GyrI-like domain-containing protein [Streptomyces sp. DSM 44938]
MTQQPQFAPAVVERPEQHYVAAREVVTMETIGRVADRLPDVFGFLGARGVEPVDAPFFKYDVIDMARRLEIEAGVPVAAPVEPAPGLIAGVLPAGRYATVTHVGHPDGLVDVTAALLEWAADRNLVWDAWDAPEGHAWRCRLEIYRTDPATEPDMNRWETQLAFRLADA